MKRIGLTGGIGSGKSTVAEMLARRGALVVDADAISRQLMEPGSPVLAQTVEVFGQQILSPDGSLDRPALAALVFSDSAQREKLNAIVHPAVRAESARLLEAAAADPAFDGFVVEDIPLLAETGQADRFDGVIVVEAELAVRLHRLVEMRGMSEQDARARIEAQASDVERRKIATWVVDNSGELAATEARVQEVCAEIEMLDR